MKVVTKDDIVRSIGVQSDFITQEILRTGACRREWARAVAIVSRQTMMPEAGPRAVGRRLPNEVVPVDQAGLSPRMRRLLDLLAVVDPLMIAFHASEAHGHGRPIARAA